MAEIQHVISYWLEENSLLSNQNDRIKICSFGHQTTDNCPFVGYSGNFQQNMINTEVSEGDGYINSNCIAYLTS